MYLVSTLGNEALPDVNESGLFNYPCGMCEVENDIYVVDKNNNAIRKIDSQRRITTVFKGLNHPTSIIYVPSQSAPRSGLPNAFYITDTGNNRVLKLSDNFTIIQSFTGFNSPMGICYTSYGDNTTLYYRIYVADMNNNSIKEIKHEDTNVSVFVVGNGITSPRCVYANQSEGGFGKINLLVGNDNTFICYIRKTTTPLPTSTQVENYVDTSFLKIQSTTQLNDKIMSISGKLDSLENKVTLYVSTNRKNVLRKFEINYTYANGFSNPVFVENIGRIPVTASQYKDGSVTNAMFSSVLGSSLHSLVSRDNNSIYISDSASHVIRKFDISSRIVNTYTGICKTPGYKDDIFTEFRDIYGISIDTDKNIYVADRGSNDFKKIDKNDGVISFLKKPVHFPLLFNADGSYFTTLDYDSSVIINNNNLLTRLSNSNRQYLYYTSCLIKGSVGKFYAVSSTNQNYSDSYITEIDTLSSTSLNNIIPTTGLGILKGPNCITYDNKRNALYIADSQNHRIRRLNLDGTNLIITIAGTGIAGFSDGPGSTSQFNNPMGVFYESSFDVLYIADTDNNKIRIIDVSESSNTVKTIAGDGTEGYIDGLGLTSKFINPTGIIVDSDRTVYVSQPDRVRKLINLNYSKSYGRGVLYKNDLYIPSLVDDGIIKIENVNSNQPTKTLWVSSLNTPTSILIKGQHMYVTNAGNNTISLIENFETSKTKKNLSISSNPLNANYLESLNFPLAMIDLGTDLYVVNSGNSTIVKIENFSSQSPSQKMTTLVASGERNKFLLKFKDTLYFDQNDQPTDGTVKFYFKKNIQSQLTTHIKFSSETIYFNILSSSYDSSNNRTYITGYLNDQPYTLTFPQPSITTGSSEYSWTVLIGSKTVLYSQSYTLDNPSDIDVYGSDLYITNLGSRDRNSFITKFHNLSNFKNFIANADRFLGGKLYGMKIHGDHIYASTLNIETGVTRIIRFKINPWSGSYIFATSESSGGTYNDVFPDNSIVNEIYISDDEPYMYAQVSNNSGEWEIIRIKNY